MTYDFGKRLLSHLPPLGAAIALALMVAAPVSASTMQFEFRHRPFSGGGLLQGSFAGTDANDDGVLTEDEVLSFEFSFTGDSILPDMAATVVDGGEYQFDHLDLTMDVSDNRIGNDPNEGILTWRLLYDGPHYIDHNGNDTYEYGQEYGIIDEYGFGAGSEGVFAYIHLSNYGPIESTSHRQLRIKEIAPVPLPASWGFLSLATLPFIGASYRRSARRRSGA